MSDQPEFKREERFIVVKRKHLDALQELQLRQWLECGGIPTSECVVVESDWPEYETVWKMIEARVTGASQPAPAQGDGRAAICGETETLCSSPRCKNGCEAATVRVNATKVNFTPYYVMSNARGILLSDHDASRMPNWVLAKNLFAVGSTTARAICEEAGVEPDSTKTERSLVQALSAQREQPQGVVVPIMAEVERILFGIDKDECEHEDGWWETSAGAEFGRQKMEELRALLGQREGL